MAITITHDRYILLIDLMSEVVLSLDMENNYRSNQKLLGGLFNVENLYYLY